MPRYKGSSRTASTMTFQRRDFDRLVGQNTPHGTLVDIEDSATVERLKHVLELLREVEHSMLRSQDARRLRGRMLRAPVTVLRQPANR